MEAPTTKREAIRDWIDDAWWNIKFEVWYTWDKLRYWWVYGIPEQPDATWQTFKIRAIADENPNEDVYAFINYIESLNLSFGGGFGKRGGGCSGWVEGPPERMRDARRKLVTWFITRGASSVYVSGLRLSDAPYPHPKLIY